MSAPLLAERAAMYLQKFCLEIPNRRVGSDGNRTATDFFAHIVASYGFAVEVPGFACIDWTNEGAYLMADTAQFEVLSSPYSLGCDVTAPLVVISSVEELEAADLDHAILLLRGPIAGEPLMPKNFPFYNPDAHKRIIHALEQQQPLAIVAATARKPELVGAVYPFPLIEDGDFDIPSAYMTEEEGHRLVAYAGKNVRLIIQATRIPATGYNVIARKGTNHQRKVVLCAHIDAKNGTPGALDNAAGTVVLLLLAELLAHYEGRLGLELVALNGEDYYSNPGEQEYLARNAGTFTNIVLGINVDGVGYSQGNTAYSLYDCPDTLAHAIDTVFATQENVVKGEAWYQGDHGLFLLNQRPALAMTSERMMELMSTIVHTAQDRPELVDTRKLVTAARALEALLLHLEQHPHR